MSIARTKDIGAFLKGKAAVNPRVVTAGSTADGSTYTGATIDRQAVTELQHCYSMKLVVPIFPNLSTGITGTVEGEVEDSADDVTFTNYPDKAGSTTFTLTIGTTLTTAAVTAEGEINADFDIQAARRYVRAVLRPSILSTATDTLDIAAVLVFGGHDVLPAA